MPLLNDISEGVKNHKDQQVFLTILQQLGGYRKLNAMLGLKDVLDHGNGGSFKIKVKGALANYVKIIYDMDTDLYNVEIGMLKGWAYDIKKQVTGIGVENLKRIVSKTTGCDLYL
jgi:hypothetical protein